MSFEIKLVQKNVTTIRLKDSKNEDIRIFSKIWNFAKVTFSYDILEQEYYYRVEVMSLSPPFSTDGRYLLRGTTRRIIQTKEFTLKLSEFQTTIIGRMSKFKVYQGELGN